MISSRGVHMNFSGRLGGSTFFSPGGRGPQHPLCMPLNFLAFTLYKDFRILKILFEFKEETLLFLGASVLSEEKTR